jgi:hypothetical protein
MVPSGLSLTPPQETKKKKKILNKNFGGGGLGIIPAFAFREYAEYLRNPHGIPTEYFLNTIRSVVLTPICSVWDSNSVVFDCERAVSAEITLSRVKQVRSHDSGAPVSLAA